MENNREEKKETKEKETQEKKDTMDMSLPAVEEEPDLQEFPITEPADSRQETHKETG